MIIVLMYVLVPVCGGARKTGAILLELQLPQLCTTAWGQQQQCDAMQIIIINGGIWLLPAPLRGSRRGTNSRSQQIDRGVCRVHVVSA